MNESFVENYLDDDHTKSFEKFECAWSSCSEYLAISVLNKKRAGTLLFYDKEFRLIESQYSSRDYLDSKIDLKISLFIWNPCLPIVACIYEDGQVGFFRIKYDTKKWIYYDTINVKTNKNSKNIKVDENNISNDPIYRNSKKNEISKFVHLNWLNEGNTLYYVANNGEVNFFNFNINENILELSNNVQIENELIQCIEVHFDQLTNLYLSSKIGVIYLVNEFSRQAIQIIQVNFLIVKMMYFKRKSKLILISDDFILHQYEIINQNCVELASVKLEIFNKSFNHTEKFSIKSESKKDKLKSSFKQEDMSVLKIDEQLGIIGVCISGERVIRLLQIDSGYNLAVIAIESTDHQWSGVNYLLYDENVKLLLASTSNNQFLIWKRNNCQLTENNKYKQENDDGMSNYLKQFEFNKLAQFLLDGVINCISVNSNEKIALILNSKRICIIEKQMLNFIFLNGLAIIQMNAHDLKFIWSNSVNQDELILNLSENVKEIFLGCSLDKLAIRTNRLNELIIIHLYDHKTYEIIKTLKNIENFKVILKENYIWQLNFNLNENKTLTNNQGLSINCYGLGKQQSNEQQIYPINLENSFKKNESVKLIVLDSIANYLLIIIQSEKVPQDYCYLVFEMDQNVMIVKCKATMISVDRQIVEAKINVDGTIIAILDGIQLFLMHVGSNKLQPIKLDIRQINQFYFASNEPRLLCVQCSHDLYIFICFIHKIDTLNAEVINYQLYDQKGTKDTVTLLGFQVPYIYLLVRNDNIQITKETLNEFNEVPIEVVRLIINFLTNQIDLNLMIKQISKISIENDQNKQNLWLNLARCSVKSRNIEMGLYCMSKLKNVRVIRDVQKELKSNSLADEKQENLALAVMAMNLNLFQEAEQLFKQSGDNWKLVQYYQCRNDWSIALKSIEKLNERSLFYDYAKYYEYECGDIKNAIKYYELSDTNEFEVTRMLFDLNELDKLKNYCHNRTLDKSISTDESKPSNEFNKLRQWYGHYCESIGDFQSSLNAYAQANDIYNQARLLCLMGDLENAKKLLSSDESNKKAFGDHEEISNTYQQNQSKNAAKLHLGKHIEPLNPAEAVQYFLDCGAINHAIKTCKTNHFDEQLTKIIQNYGSKNEIIELLQRLDETPENFEILFDLYKKIEIIDKCLEIGFRGRLWSQMRILLNDYQNQIQKNNSCEYFDKNISDFEKPPDKINKLEISDKTIELSLEYLENNSRIVDIVINILFIKGNCKDLIKDVILRYKIEINNELINKIIKIFDETPNESKLLLQSLAESAMIQGEYLLAAKLFNSANDRINSIKALTRLGDVQKVINYANISKDKNIYKIAASFLQTTKGNEKMIEKFYRKANIKREAQIDFSANE